MRGHVRTAATDAGFGIVEQTKLVTAASELARNILHYAESPVADQIVAIFKRIGDAVLLKQDTPKALVEKASTDVQKALDDYYAKKK